MTPGRAFVSEIGLGVLLFAAPFAFGSVPQWAFMALAAAVFLILTLVPSALNEISNLPRPFASGFLLFFLYLAFQVLIISLNRYETALELLKWMAAAGLFLIAQTLSVSCVTRLGCALVAAGSLEALYGFYQLSTGDQSILWQAKEFHGGFLTGTFMNRNHMAGFFSLCLGVHLGLGLKALTEGGKKTLLAWGFFFILLVTAFLKTGSRSGIVSFGASSLLVSLFLFVTGNARARFFVAFLILGSLASVFFLGGPLWQRFGELGDQWHSLEGRLVVWADTLRLLKDHLWFGIGLGSFEWVFPSYQSAGLFWGWRHAHNDYLELAAALGLPAFLFWMTAIGSLWFLLTKKMMQAEFPHRAMMYGILIAVTASLLHALTDFNWAVPANTTVLVILCGMAFNLCRDRSASFPLRLNPFLIRAITLALCLLTAQKAWAGIWLHAGEQALKRGDLSAANQYLEKAIPWDKANPRLLYLSGLAALRRGIREGDSTKLEEASIRFQMLTKKLPYYGRAWFYRALACVLLAKHSTGKISLEEWRGVQSDLEKARLSEPGSAWMGTVTAKLILTHEPSLSEEGKAAALAQMKESLASHERRYASPYLIPALHFLWEKFSDFTILREITPPDFISTKKLVEFCEKKKLWRHHEEIFPAFLAMRRETYQSLIAEGEELFQKDDYARALERFQRAHWLEAFYPEARTGIVKSKSKLGLPIGEKEGAAAPATSATKESALTAHRSVEDWYGKGFKNRLLHQKGRMGVVVVLPPGKVVFSLRIRSFPGLEKEFGYVLIRLRDRVVKAAYVDHQDWEVLEWPAETPGGRHWLELELKNGAEPGKRGPLVEIGELNVRYET